MGSGLRPSVAALAGWRTGRQRMSWQEERRDLRSLTGITHGRPEKGEDREVFIDIEKGMIACRMDIH